MDRKDKHKLYNSCSPWGRREMDSWRFKKVNLTVSIMYFRAFMTKYQYLFILGVIATYVKQNILSYSAFLIFSVLKVEKRGHWGKFCSTLARQCLGGVCDKFTLVSSLRLVEYVTLKCVNTSWKRLLSLRV